MTTRIKLSILTILASIATHTYLTLHYYKVKLGLASANSLCNINEVFDCNAVSASSYSAFLNIPLSLWGGTAHLLLLGLLLMLALRLVDEVTRVQRYIFWLTLAIAATSIVMATISVSLLSTYCLFCITSYKLSFLTLSLLWNITESSPWPYLSRDLLHILKSTKASLIPLVVVPGLSYISHNAIMSSYNAAGFDKNIQNFVSEWWGGKKYELKGQPSLTSGPERSVAKVTVTEFADFLCGHCKHAVPSLHAFAKSHPDVRMEFYSFPLDGACNKAIQRAGGGVSCFLAKAVLCVGQKDQALGWKFHSDVFEQQEVFQRAGTISNSENALKKILTNHSLSWDEIKTCIRDPDTHDKIEAQAKAGEQAQVQGTPAIYMNGKKLPGGQFIPVLKRARQKALETQ